MRKTLLILVMVVLLSVGMLTSAIWAQDAITIRMWTWFDDFQTAFPKIVEKWNTAHPDIRVEQQIFSLNEYLQKLQAAVAGGSEPDIFGPHVMVRSLGEAGVSLDLNQYLDEEFLSRFTPGTIRQFTWNGHLYSLPWTAQTFGIFYNKDIFARMGLKIPETWDELIETSHTIRAMDSSIQPLPFGNRDKWLGCDFFLPLITQVTDDPTLVLDLDRRLNPERKVSWNSEPVIEALRLVEKLVKEEVFAPGINGLAYDQSLTMFYMGKGAMFYCGSWLPVTIDREAPEGFNWDVFETPAYAPGKRHWTGNESGANLAISARSKHIKETIEFLKFMYSPEVYTEAMIEARGMPAMPEILAGLENPIVKKMASWLKDGAPHILYGEGSWDAVANAVQGLMGGQLTPEEAAAQIENDVQRARSR
ncbi:ABC transporter substrate-binding protein [Atrimonas thermophila]|uniref:ABC transporter substrate-binding protein n=1 Tax=Atrimonas thermophila TaxID=3064161 RepID=UPI00399C5E9A